MKELELVELKKYILILCEEYGNEFSGARFKIWLQILKDYDFAAIKRALEACLCECTFFPRIADVLRHLHAAENPKLKAAEAWADVLQGLQTSTPPTNECSKKIVRLLGGIKELSMCPSRDLAFKRLEFLKLHEEYTKNAILPSKILIDSEISKKISEG